MRIDTLLISLFLFTLGTVGCSQPEAVKAEYEPANCDCVEQTNPSEAPPAHTHGLADEPTQPPTTIAQAAQRAFEAPAEATPDDFPAHEGTTADETADKTADKQAQPAAGAEEPPRDGDEETGKEAGKTAEGGPNGVVNLNTASVDQLMALPGVGPALAARIVEFRQKRRFEEPEHLLRVRGIGKSTFAKLAPMLAVSGATTLRK